MRWLVLQLLSEQGDISTMRLMSLLSLVIGAGIAIYGIAVGKDLGGLAQITGVFVSAAFLGKVTQKFAEGNK